MESSEVVLMLWWLTCLSDPLAGYPNGRVEEACSSMVPLHGHASPQSSPVHTITVNVTEFGPGDHVKGTVWFLQYVTKVVHAFFVPRYTSVLENIYKFGT